jgi:predicted nucleic acid-binding protein
VEKSVPTPIFVDTLFVIALINHRDQYHQQASSLADQFEGHSLIVTDAVLLEIGNALSRGYKRQASEVIQHFFDSDEIEVVSPDFPDGLK